MVHRPAWFLLISKGPGSQALSIFLFFYIYLLFLIDFLQIIIFSFFGKLKLFKVILMWNFSELCLIFTQKSKLNH
jgi:hypothetical protein